MRFIKASLRTCARGAPERSSILFYFIRAIRVFRIAGPVSNVILRELLPGLGPMGRRLCALAKPCTSVGEPPGMGFENDSLYVL